MSRNILHVDCNKFYASVECCLDPTLRNKPVVVGGSEASRHGIVLTKNEVAAKYNLSAGEPLWSARQKCPDLIVIPPHYDLYARFSRKVRDILERYTDRIEPFGLDESWIQLNDGEDSMAVAEAIRQTVKEELGITVSIGVSFNKTFAKLGSDYRKPDAITRFSRDNFRELVWPLPAADMIFVGPATARRLEQRYIRTIGDIANASPRLLQAILGRWGLMLHAMANGEDQQPVVPTGQEKAIQSVSNGVTTPRDMENDRDVKVVLTALGESVGRRLREQHLAGRVVEVQWRDVNLQTAGKQAALPYALQTTDDLIREGFALFRRSYGWEKPLRSITLRVTALEADLLPSQTDFLGEEQRFRRDKLDKTVDWLKQRFGDGCVRRGVMLEDPVLGGIAPYDTHTVHPVGFSGKLPEAMGGEAP